MTNLPTRPTDLPIGVLASMKAISRVPVPAAISNTRRSVCSIVVKSGSGWNRSFPPHGTWTRSGPNAINRTACLANVRAVVAPISAMFR